MAKAGVLPTGSLVAASGRLRILEAERNRAVEIVLSSQTGWRRGGGSRLSEQVCEASV